MRLKGVVVDLEKSTEKRNMGTNATGAHQRKLENGCGVTCLVATMVA